MKNLKIKTLFVGMFVAASLALTACGGGGDDGGGLAAGVAGTAGDGANQGEFDAVQKGMSVEQVLAIVADAPTYRAPRDTFVQWQKGSVIAVVAFDGNGGTGVIEKAITSDGKVIADVKF